MKQLIFVCMMISSFCFAGKLGSGFPKPKFCSDTLQNQLYALMRNKDALIVDAIVLINKGADPFLTDPRTKQTPIQIAVSEKNAKMVSFIQALCDDHPVFSGITEAYSENRDKNYIRDDIL